MTYARKVDSNQKQLVKQMRQIPGVSVAHTHMVSKGFPDLALGYKGRCYLLEVKDKAKSKSAKKLTPDEQDFRDNWKGDVYVVECIEDVLKIINP